MAYTVDKEYSFSALTGTPANDVMTKYSQTSDLSETTKWHEVYQEGDEYMIISTDGGATWSETAMKIKGEQGDTGDTGPEVGYQILRGTNSFTNIDLVSTSSDENAKWINRGWRIASVSAVSGVIREVIDIDDCPNPSITKGLRAEHDVSIDTTTRNCMFSQNAVPLTVGEKYTISYYARGNGKVRGYLTGKEDTFNLTDNWKQYSVTITATDVSANFYIGLYNSGITENQRCEVCGMKVELGETATQWVEYEGDTIPKVDVTKTGGTTTVSITDVDGTHSKTIEDGKSPTVKLTSVEGGVKISITNADGTVGDEATVTDGENGHSFVPKGDYVSGTKYNLLEVVNKDGDSYVCMVSKSSTTFVDSEWTLLSATPDDHYIHFVYCNAYTLNDDGTTKSVTDYSTNESKKYIGTYTDEIESDASSTQIIGKSVTWSKVEGDEIDTKVYYGKSSSSSTQPTDWNETIPSVSSGEYLWTKTEIYINGTLNETKYDFQYQSKDGKDNATITYSLSSPNVSVSCDKNGNPSSLAGTYSDLHVYQNNVELTFNTNASGNKEYKVTAKTSSGCVSSDNPSKKDSKYCLLPILSVLRNDNAYREYTVSGKDSNGTAFSFVIKQTFSKNKTGDTGDTGDSGITKECSVESLKFSQRRDGLMNYDQQTFTCKLLRGSTVLTPSACSVFPTTGDIYASDNLSAGVYTITVTSTQGKEAPKNQVITVTLTYDSIVYTFKIPIIAVVTGSYKGSIPTLPNASESELGNYYCYSGTDGTYKKSYVYVCVRDSDGYKWQKDNTDEANSVAFSDIMNMIDDATSQNEKSVALLSRLVAAEAFMHRLFVNKIKLQNEGADYGAIYGGDKYLEDGTVNPEATEDSKGFHLSADGFLKCNKGKFTDVELTGIISSDNYDEVDETGIYIKSFNYFGFYINSNEDMQSIKNVSDPSLLPDTYPDDSSYILKVITCNFVDINDNILGAMANKDFEIRGFGWKQGYLYISDTEEEPKSTDYISWDGSKINPNKYIWIKYINSRDSANIVKGRVKNSSGYKLKPDGNTVFFNNIAVENLNSNISIINKCDQLLCTLMIPCYSSVYPKFSLMLGNLGKIKGVIRIVAKVIDTNGNKETVRWSINSTTYETSDILDNVFNISNSNSLDISAEFVKSSSATTLAMYVNIFTDKEYGTFSYNQLLNIISIKTLCGPKTDSTKYTWNIKYNDNGTAKAYCRYIINTSVSSGYDLMMPIPFYTTDNIMPSNTSLIANVTPLSTSDFSASVKLGSSSYPTWFLSLRFKNITTVAATLSGAFIAIESDWFKRKMSEA